jgi:hypothetical protein
LNETVVVVETWSPQVRLWKVRHGIAFMAHGYSFHDASKRDLQEQVAV